MKKDDGWGVLILAIVALVVSSAVLIGNILIWLQVR